MNDGFVWSVRRTFPGGKERAAPVDTIATVSGNEIDHLLHVFNPAIRRRRLAASLIRRSHGSITIANLCSRLDVGYKQLQRVFRDDIGIGPKLYAQITRFKTEPCRIRTRHRTTCVDIISTTVMRWR